MAESQSREVFFLKQVANQKYDKDFAVNLVQVNNTLSAISKYLIVMQQGIDDLNRDIFEQIRDLIREIIIIFNGGDFAELGLDWGDLKYVFRAIGQFFGFPEWAGNIIWTPIQMVQNFFTNFLSGLSSFGNFVHNAFDSAIDFILGLLSWIPGVGTARQRFAAAMNKNHEDANAAKEKAQELTNKVWEGATTVEVTEDLTAQQVRDAVAALKARSESLRQENELRYQTAVPLWQGLIPGGDVTCDINNVSVRDNWNINVTGNSGNTSLHTHGAGSYQVNVAIGNGHAITSQSGSNLTGPMALFRARSDSSRNVISFLARGVGSITEGRCTLWTYDYDNDRWMCVGITEDYSSQLPMDYYDWVEVYLNEEYTPSVGELMAVGWNTTGTGTSLVATSLGSSSSAGEWSIPKYNSVPYGNNVVVTQSGTPTVGRTLSLPKEANWRIGKIPFSQIAPDLGQVYTSPPQYWFDDFNNNDSSNYNRGGGAKISGGRFGYSGTTDGIQYIVYKGQMSTDRMAIEATLSGTNAAPTQMRLHTTSNGACGVGMWIRSGSSARIEFFRTGASSPTDLVDINEVDGLPTGAARWRLEFDPDTKTYIVKRNGSTIYTWADPTNLALRGKGKRTGGLGVSRALFINSPSWDDLLIYDIDEEVS